MKVEARSRFTKPVGETGRVWKSRCIALVPWVLGPVSLRGS